MLAGHDFSALSVCFLKSKFNLSFCSLESQQQYYFSFPFAELAEVTAIASIGDVYKLRTLGRDQLLIYCRKQKHKVTAVGQKQGIPQRLGRNIPFPALTGKCAETRN